jgi:hypothetical protein
MRTRVSTGVLIAIATLFLFLVCAAIAQEPKSLRLGYGRDTETGRPHLVLCKAQKTSRAKPQTMKVVKKSRKTRRVEDSKISM